MDEMELCMVPLVLVQDDSDEETDRTSSSLGCCSCRWSHSMMDAVSVQGLGVTIVMAVGFLGVVAAAAAAEAAISAEEHACKVVCWYDDVTELFVMEVVDLDLCHDFGLGAVVAVVEEEEDGPAKPKFDMCINSSDPAEMLKWIPRFTYLKVYRQIL